MIADIGVVEAVGKVIVPETIPATKLSATDKAAQEIKKSLDEKGVDAGLKTAADRMGTVDISVSSRSIDENIGSQRDDEGKMVLPSGSNEEKLHNNAKIVEKYVTEYLDKGYDGLTDVAQKKAIRDSVENVVLSIPAIRAQYDVITDATKKTEFLERIARDPNYSKLVAEGMNGIIDPAKIQKETISQLTLQLESFNSELQIINNQLEVGKYSIEARIKRLKADIQDFESGTSITKPSKRNEQTAKLKGEQVGINSDIETIGETRDVLKNDLDTFKEAKHRLKAFHQTEIEIEGTKYNIKQIDAEIRSRTKLFNEKNTEYTGLLSRKEEISLLLRGMEGGRGEEALREDLDQALKDEADLKKKKIDLENKIKAKKQEIGTAKTDRIYHEEAFVKSLENVFNEAAGKYFEVKVNEAETSIKNYLEKAATDLKEGAESALAKGLLLRYYYDKSNKVNLTNIRADKDKIVTIGPEEILDQGLIDGGYTKKQIEELKKDKTKWNSLMTKTAEITLKHYWLKGGLFGREGKMQLDEQMKIVNSPWGNEVLKNSVEAARKDVEAVMKQKLPDRSRIGEWLRKLDGKWLLAIIAILVALGYFAMR